MLKKLLPIVLASVAFSVVSVSSQAHTRHHHENHHHKQSVVRATAEPVAAAKIADPDATNPLVKLVNRTIRDNHYSTYRLGGTYFNLTRGVFIIDCSGYLDKLLQAAEPQAFQQVVKASGTARPNSLSYFNFIKKLPLYTPKQNWYRITKVSELTPGSVLIFRYKNLYGRRAGGHVMIIVSKPKVYKNNSHEYIVRVADSTPFPHSRDTRNGRRCGIGEGTMLLHVNNAGYPNGYAWSVGAHFEHEMKYAMAQPLA